MAVGRAIVREPKVFLFDEPLSNLDAKLRVETRANISKLHQRLQTTFIYVTHDQVEAMTMATRIAVIKSGLLQQLDTPQHLYDHPANVFVAGFIGSPAMNFFNARLEKVDGGLVVDAGTFQRPRPTGQGRPLRRLCGQADGLRHPAGGHPRSAIRAAGDSHRTGRRTGGRHRADGKRDLPLPAGRHVELRRARRPAHRTSAPACDTRIVFNMDNMHLFEPDGDQRAIE